MSKEKHNNPVGTSSHLPAASSSSSSHVGGSVVVIGAGIAGLVAAHELAERGDTVRVIERLKHPLQGTSDVTPGRIGLGLHYADTATAKGYLEASITFARAFLLHPETKALRFVVGEDKPWNHPLRHGLYGITKDSNPPLEELLKIYIQIREHYRALVRQDSANELFGKPDDFLKVLYLSPDYRSKEGKTAEQITAGLRLPAAENMGKIDLSANVVLSNVAAIIETQEHLLDWPRFKEWFLSKHQAITVETETTATRVSFAPGMQYTVEATDKDGKPKYYAAQTVLNCTWGKIEEVTASLVGEPEVRDRLAADKRVNRMKILVEVTLPEDKKGMPSLFLALGGATQGMFSNMGNGIGRITLGVNPDNPLKTTNHSSETELAPSEKYERWCTGRLTAEDEAELNLYATEILKGLVKHMPWLKDAKISHIYTGIVRSGMEIYQRNTDGSDVKDPRVGFVENPGTKFFASLMNALRAVGLIEEHRQLRVKIKQMAATLATQQDVCRTLADILHADEACAPDKLRDKANPVQIPTKIVDTVGKKKALAEEITPVAEEITPVSVASLKSSLRQVELGGCTARLGKERRAAEEQQAALEQAKRDLEALVGGKTTGEESGLSLAAQLDALGKSMGLKGSQPGTRTSTPQPGGSSSRTSSPATVSATNYSR